ncbi:MAG: M13 family metallopeptidase, partial [Bacteroidales bacterium]|nr:M13 family metallopeptidase [Bacteroidales bacterium]
MEDKALNLNDLDTSVSPATDFYAYATGGWQKNNPLPNDKSRFGTFDILGEETNAKVKNLIQDLSKQENKENSDEWNIATFYNLGMNEEKLNADGYAPIKGYLDEIDAVTDKSQLVDMLANLHSKGISAFFSVFGTSDPANSNLNIPWYYQGGLGLPVTEYYTNEGKEADELRGKYVEHIGKMFQLIGYEETDACGIAKNVFAIEDKLASFSMNSEEQRDPYAYTNKMDMPEIVKLSPNFDIEKYFEALGISIKQNINVGQPKFMTGVSQIIADCSLDDIKHYLKWCVLNEAASYLSDDISAQNFSFYGTVLSGTPEQAERWKRVVRVVNDNLGECVGKLFVEKHFTPESKERMVTLVENLRSAFGERIKNLDWMSDVTKEKALEKLAAITVKIGYPDKWKDYSKLVLKNDSYYANIIRCNEFEFEDMISKLGKPVDKTEWLMSPQTVNAYYSPNFNEICFPAGILQPPFFYA